MGGATSINRMVGSCRRSRLIDSISRLIPPTARFGGIGDFRLQVVAAEHDNKKMNSTVLFF
jgi:hypothetical protein